MPNSVYKSLLVTDRGSPTRNTTEVHFILSLPISSKTPSSISLLIFIVFVEALQFATMAPLVWLVTGASAGIGAALVEEIVRRGDKVIAANRQVDQMADRSSENVSLLELDITSGSKVIASKVQEAWQIFGHIDVLVNNAGTFLFAPFEDIWYVRYIFGTGSHQLTLVLCAAMMTQNVSSKPTSSVSFT